MYKETSSFIVTYVTNCFGHVLCQRKWKMEKLKQRDRPLLLGSFPLNLALTMLLEPGKRPTDEAAICFELLKKCTVREASSRNNILSGRKVSWC